MNKPQISGPAYRIVTQRLVIRCWQPADAPLLQKALEESLEHLRPWMPWAKDEPTDLQDKINRLRLFRGQFDLGQDFVYAIFSRDENRVLGGTGLHPRTSGNSREIGYWIHKDFLNRGLATEVSAALTKVAFEIELVDRVEIHIEPSNARSAAIPAKLGYRHEATLGRRLLSGSDEPRDSMIWTLFASDYANSPTATADIEAFDAAGRKIL